MFGKILRCFCVGLMLFFFLNSLFIEVDWIGRKAASWHEATNYLTTWIFASICIAMFLRTWVSWYLYDECYFNSDGRYDDNLALAVLFALPKFVGLILLSVAGLLAVFYTPFQLSLFLSKLFEMNIFVATALSLVAWISLFFGIFRLMDFSWNFSDGI